MTSLLQPAPNIRVCTVRDGRSSPRLQNGIFPFRHVPRNSISSPTSKARTFALLEKTLGTIISDLDVKIRHFCDMGNLDKAVELLPLESNLELMTYCMLLQLCADRKSLNNGRKVHSALVSRGAAVNGIMGAKLVFMYVRCGDLKQAREVFNTVANEKVFLWNLMISEYAKVGEFKECVAMFQKMLALNVELNSHTFTSVLKFLSASGSSSGGEAVHGCAVKMGLSSYNNVANALIAFYFKVGRVENAFKVFDELSDRDVVSWNSMISGCVANNAAEEALEAFLEMLQAGVAVDSATLINVLSACAGRGSLQLGRAAHGLAVKSGCAEEVTVSNVLIDMYSKCGDLIEAGRVFDRMRERSVVSWTSLMAGFTREGLSGKAISLFRRMDEEGVKPDVCMITSVLHACALAGSLESGRAVHDLVRKNGLGASLAVCNALIDMYAKCGAMADGRRVFDELRTRRDVVSWNALIGGYTRNRLYNEAVGMFVQMQPELRPDGFTVACVLPAFANLAELVKGRQIHGYALRNGFSSDLRVANALIDMYVKCGALVLARSLFDSLPVKNPVSWCLMVAGYAKHGLGREAIDAFTRICHAGIPLDEASFISILRACSHSGLLDEGYRIFNVMRHSCGIEARLEHYACIVEMLSRAGKLPQAYTFIRKMPVEPDARIWGSLLAGCRVHHDVKLAEKVAEEVFRLEPENTGYYLLLANVYAEAERWEEVEKLKKRISRRGSSSCSWIQVGGKVEIFFAGGDVNHPQKNKIDALLAELRNKMGEEGKRPKMKYALIDAEEVEKEAARCGHSESLAMAFGVLNGPPGKPVRVIKNHRVCVECHETAKLMSKVTRREIIIRDSNRFHRFKDGACSCRGYC
uniref:DYW domain-containing protein n=1 Tax=Kalanchoe fedtschenkoi TaxID=63787 RepID=A0A7N0U2R7_KALFE